MISTNRMEQCKRMNTACLGSPTQVGTREAGPLSNSTPARVIKAAHRRPSLLHNLIVSSQRKIGRRSTSRFGLTLSSHPGLFLCLLKSNNQGNYNIRWELLCSYFEVSRTTFCDDLLDLTRGSKTMYTTRTRTRGSPSSCDSLQHTHCAKSRNCFAQKMCFYSSVMQKLRENTTKQYCTLSGGPIGQDRPRMFKEGELFLKKRDSSRVNLTSTSSWPVYRGRGEIALKNTRDWST